MLLTLVFAALAADPVIATPAPTGDPAAPVPVDPCIVVPPAAPAPAADPALPPLLTAPGPITTVAPPANCPAVDPAAAPPAEAKKKKSLKKTDNNRMEAESKDE